jgi:hypothetical protein
LLAGEIPLNIKSRNLIACHIGLDLVVPFQDGKELVEVLVAHIFHAKIVDIRQIELANICVSKGLVL